MSSTSSASSQVEICHRPVSWRFSRLEFGETLQFYDDYHEEIILINSEFIYKSHKQSSKLNKFNIKIPNHSGILNAKFSPQNKYIGLQINAHELQIKTIRGEIVAIQQCRNIKSGNKIINFHWILTKDANLCIITRNGIELYGFISSKKSIHLYKSIKYETKHNWYLPSQQFIMLVNNNFVFYGLKLTYSKIEKINKFEIVGIDNNNKQYSQITLIDINNNNNNIGCIFIDERKTKLYLFKVIRHQMQLTHSYHLYSTGKYAIFHIDNVLLAYNKNTEMPILIDFNGNNYISAPLPISMCYYEGLGDPKKPKRIFSTQKHIHIPLHTHSQTHSNDKRVSKSPPKTAPPSIKNNKMHKINKIASKRYDFLSPLFILEEWTEEYSNNALEYDSGNFYTLSLNLDAIVHSWGPERQIPLLHFLLHRKTSESKIIIIKMLYDMIKYYCLGYKYDLRSRLDFISEYFIVLNEVLRRAVEESAIIAQNHHHQQQLLLQQQQTQSQQAQAAASSFTARFRKQSQNYAQKLFGTPPNISANTSFNGLPPPPHLPNRSKSAANVTESYSYNYNNHLPPPPPGNNQSHSHQNNNMIGRRVAATVKFDLEKTSQGETVIKTTELLQDIFNPIYNILIRKHKEINHIVCGQDIKEDAEDCDTKLDEFKLSDNGEWNKCEIDKCLNRFLSVLIEYTRTMHRIRLKLPISISMLLIKLLRYTNKLYTLHQLFQYHAFPDDEKLAVELLDIGNAACKQLGIDMLLRLNRWSKICLILLKENEIEVGVRLFLEKYPFDKKNNVQQIQLSDFLSKAFKIDPVRFYHLYQGLNMIISSHHSIFSYYSDYYTQTLYGGGGHNQNENEKGNKAERQQPGGMHMNSSNAKKYGYNNNSRATNLHVLFADEMYNFKARFDSLHDKFYDDEDHE